jgi:hypothetical protein
LKLFSPTPTIEIKEKNCEDQSLLFAAFASRWAMRRWRRGNEEKAAKLKAEREKANLSLKDPL